MYGCWPPLSCAVSFNAPPTRPGDGVGTVARVGCAGRTLTGSSVHKLATLMLFTSGLYCAVQRQIPAAFTAIVAGLRVSFGQAWRTLVGAEFIAAPTAGLGYMIFNARNLLQVDVMFAGLFTLGLFGFLFIYAIIGWIEQRTLVRWGVLSKR